MSMRPENIKWSNHTEEVNVLNKALYWKISIQHQILFVSVRPQPFAVNINIVVDSLANFFFFHSKWIGGVQGRLSWRKCFPFCPIKTLNLPNYSEDRRGKKKKHGGKLYTPDLSYFFLADRLWVLHYWTSLFNDPSNALLSGSAICIWANVLTRLFTQHKLSLFKV